MDISKLVAQPPQDLDIANMKKYWWYRYRLVNDFMVKGEGPGKSLPMEERDQYLQPIAKIAKWGDCTINLGHYIGVLATEYALLSEQGQPTDTTKQELFYAISAINRLDNNAEAYYSSFGASQAYPLNGFFMRDDVPSSFLIDNPNLANGVTSSRIINTVDADNLEGLETNEMSVDQVYDLMVGFALVSKFIPDNTYYIPDKSTMIHKPFADGETGFAEEIKNINDRIISRLADNNWIVYIPGTSITPAHDRGWEAIDFSYGVAEAAKYIKEPESYPNIFAVPVRTCEPFPSLNCDRYHNLISFATSTLWMNMGVTYAPFSTIVNNTEDYKLQSLAAIGNSWWTRASAAPDPIAILSVLFNPYFIIHPLQQAAALAAASTPIPPINLTIPTLTYRAAGFSYEHTPLLRKVLHPGVNSHSFSFLFPYTSLNQSHYEDLLNSAPNCGPYNFGIGNMSTYEWSSDNRINNSERRGQSLAGGGGEYNGLDYMLYYNLYHLIDPNTVPMVNYMDRDILFDFPTSSGAGSTGMPCVIEAFNTISASNNVGSTADVTYHAGNEIALLPGFSAQSGSNFSAYIQAFTCSETDGYRHTITNASSKYPPTENLVAYTGQTTYVYYAKRTDNDANVDNNDYLNATEQNTSNTVSVTTPSTSAILQNISGINIIPNPNNGTFQITVMYNNKSIGVKELKVYDIMGKEIWSAGSSKNIIFQIDISDYSPGLYYVRCINEVGETETKKIIKH